jgi:hypothetical protein
LYTIVVTYPCDESQLVVLVIAGVCNSVGVRVVRENGLEERLLAVAVICTSPTLVLKAVPVLVILIEAPLDEDRLTSLLPAVTCHVVPAPPEDVNVIRVV